MHMARERGPGRKCHWNYHSEEGANALTTSPLEEKLNRELDLQKKK